MSAGTQMPGFSQTFTLPHSQHLSMLLLQIPFATTSTPQLQTPLQTQSGGAPIQVPAKQTNIILRIFATCVSRCSLSVSFISHKGESNESAKRLTLLHEMMDALSGMPENEESRHGVLEVSMYYCWLSPDSTHHHPSCPDSAHLQPIKNSPNSVHPPSCALSPYICDLERSEARPRGPTSKEEDICTEGVRQDLEAELGAASSAKKVEGVPGKLTCTSFVF
jgi:hypothetical protein